jgi:hypothetical protein
MANQDYYGDAGGGSPAATAPKPGDEEDSSGGQTALLPKSIFGGKELKPGDKVEVTVARVREDAYEVEYSQAEEEQPQESAAAPEGGGDEGGGGSMAGMME